MAQSAPTNRKKLLLPTTMSKSGWAIVEARDDVEGVSFVPTVPKAEFHQLLEEASGICLGVQVMNVAAGGTLIQDIDSEMRTDIEHASERVEIPELSFQQI